MAAAARIALALGAGLAFAGPAAAQTGDAAALARIDALEAEVRRLTAALERAEFERREAVAAIRGKLEELDFRVVELEGGDPTAAPAAPADAPAAAPAPAALSSAGGEPSPRPGAGAPTAATPERTGPGAPPRPLGSLSAEITPEHRAAFNEAAKVAERGDGAATQAAFDAFFAAWPGSPLSGEAWRQIGAVYAAEGRHQDAARAYLTGVRDHGASAAAAENLLGLAEALTDLGRFEQACSTLAELESRFPDPASATRMRARDAAARAGCR
jgi:TolA-binding protein